MTRRTQVLTGLVVVGFAAAGVQLAALLSDQLTMGQVTADPAAVAGLPWWTGSASILTSQLWAVAATVNAVAWHVSRARRLLGLSSLALLLGIDDSLLLHEAALPALGVPELAVMLCYAAIGLVVALWWLPSRRSWPGSAFFAGAIFLGVSVLFDLASPRSLYLFEDGAKTVGVLAWCLTGAWSLQDALSGHNRHRAADAA